MGPEATILLQQKLVEAVAAEDDHDHIPLFVDMNPQVPSRIDHLISGEGEDPGPVLAAMARRLEKAGASALAMPCNTAHYYAGAITEGASIPLLNMVELAAEHALATVGKGGCAGMLASPAVRRTQLFETALEARGISVIWPRRDEVMLSAIRSIKAQGPTAAAREALYEASLELSAAGADMQFVACSEFSIIAGSVAPGIVAADTLDLLVATIVKFSDR